MRIALVAVSALLLACSCAPGGLMRGPRLPVRPVRQPTPALVARPRAPLAVPLPKGASAHLEHPVIWDVTLPVQGGLAGVHPTHPALACSKSMQKAIGSKRGLFERGMKLEPKENRKCLAARLFWDCADMVVRSLETARTEARNQAKVDMFTEFDSRRLGAFAILRHYATPAVFSFCQGMTITGIDGIGKEHNALWEEVRAAWSYEQALAETAP